MGWGEDMWIGKHPAFPLTSLSKSEASLSLNVGT